MGLLQAGKVAVVPGGGALLPVAGTFPLCDWKTLSAASPETTAGRQTQVKHCQQVALLLKGEAAMRLGSAGVVTGDL